MPLATEARLVATRGTAFSVAVPHLCNPLSLDVWTELSLLSFQQGRQLSSRLLLLLESYHFLLPLLLSINQSKCHSAMPLLRSFLVFQFLHFTIFHFEWLLAALDSGLKEKGGIETLSNKETSVLGKI